MQALLRSHALRAKKSWGQNFLIAEGVYEAIVSQTVRSPKDWIVEIGAGLGTLTARLAQRVPRGKVIAIERDRDLVTILREQFDSVPTIEIVEEDAMGYDYDGLAAVHGQPLTLCGNLPYHLSGRILFHTVALRQCLSHAVVMVQREVANRLIARVGTKEYGALTAILRPFVKIAIVKQVSANAFFPVPKVQSAVVRLEFLSDEEVLPVIANVSNYVTVVKAAFSQRRKTLRNSLATRFSGTEITFAEKQTCIDFSRRGETLDPHEFALLASALPAVPVGENNA